jgi:hypothetical protein
MAHSENAMSVFTFFLFLAFTSFGGLLLAFQVSEVCVLCVICAPPLTHVYSLPSPSSSVFHNPFPQDEVIKVDGDDDAANAHNASAYSIEDQE